MTMYEKWLPVVGYEGLYEVSWSGRVRSVDRVVVASNGVARQMKGRVLKCSPGNHGYAQAILCKGDGGRSYLVHRLVLEAFEGPCPEGLEACHNDGDQTINVWDNLRWDTGSSNMVDKVNHGRHHNTNKDRCKNGHPYTPENVYKKNGRRHCRECGREAQRAYRARKKMERSMA